MTAPATGPAGGGMTAAGAEPLVAKRIAGGRRG